MEERRKFERRLTSIRVEMDHPSFGTVTGFARDLSDGGASVLVDVSEYPPMGTVLNVKFKRVSGRINKEAVKMRVMALRRNVLGLMFV